MDMEGLEGGTRLSQCACVLASEEHTRRTYVSALGRVRQVQRIQSAVLRRAARHGHYAVLRRGARLGVTVM